MNNKLTKREMILGIVFFTIIILLTLGGGYIDQQFLIDGIIH